MFVLFILYNDDCSNLFFIIYYTRSDNELIYINKYIQLCIYCIFKNIIISNVFILLSNQFIFT